jgi:hypothetical protein
MASACITAEMIRKGEEIWRASVAIFISLV